MTLVRTTLLPPVSDGEPSYAQLFQCPADLHTIAHLELTFSQPTDGGRWVAAEIQTQAGQIVGQSWPVLFREGEVLFTFDPVISVTPGDWYTITYVAVDDAETPVRLLPWTDTQ